MSHKVIKMFAVSIAQEKRIYHECEDMIEKSFLRVAVWPHEACRVMAETHFSSLPSRE